MPFGGEKRNKTDRWGKKEQDDRRKPKSGFKGKEGFKKDYAKPADKKRTERSKSQFVEEADERDDYYINLIEGRNPVLEALKSGREIDKLFVQSGQTEGSIKQIIAIARDKRILIKEVDKAKLDRMSATKSHQGVIASAALYKYYEIDDILEIARQKGEDPFIVILDEITDPQNLGSILRSCDGAGVHGVIIPKRRAASLTPIIGKISAGAVEYVPVAKVTNINQTMEYLKEKGLWIAGADVTGEAYYEKDMTGPLAIVVGSEGKGLSRLVKDNCDFIVGIPMVGKISSLNAAISCAVLIFEAKKQKKLKNAAGSLQDGSIH